MRPLSLLFAAALAAAAPAAVAQALDGLGQAINALRAERGLAPLAADPRLAQAAQAHAEDMAQNGFFDHRGSDGTNVRDRARRSGCAGRAYAENIARGPAQAQGAFAIWAGSPPHAANMLGAHGVFGAGAAGGFWVVVFADRC